VTTIAVIAAGAGGVETLRSGLIEPLLAEGHTVAITLTPTAGEWLRALGEVTRLEALTGLSVRDRSRLPGEPSPHPLIDVYVAAPMTANSTAKVALGIADNQAVTVLNENIGRDAPMILFPGSMLPTPATRPGPATWLDSDRPAWSLCTATTSGPSQSRAQPENANSPGQRSSAPSSSTAESAST